MAKPERTTPYFSIACRNIISSFSAVYNIHKEIWGCFFFSSLIFLLKCTWEFN